MLIDKILKMCRWKPAKAGINCGQHEGGPVAALWQSDSEKPLPVKVGEMIITGRNTPSLAPRLLRHCKEFQEEAPTRCSRKKGNGCKQLTGKFWPESRLELGRNKGGINIRKNFH